MVSFYNIKIENGIFTATAVNEYTGNKEEISAKTDGSYHSSKDNDIVKATWGLIVKYEHSKRKKIPETDCVAWS